MKCKFCGNDLPEESKFCPSCGAPVEPEENPSQAEQPEEADQTGQPEQGSQQSYEYGVPKAENDEPYQYGNTNQNNDNPYQYGNAGQNTYTDNGSYGQPQKPINGTTYLVFAIISTLLCCLPLGIVAIVYASKINSLQRNGDYVGAQNAAKKAKMFTIIGTVAALVISIFYIIFAVVIGIGDSDYDDDSVSNVVENVIEDKSESATTDSSDEADKKAENVKPAEASDELGTNWDSYTVQINDSVMTFPCDVSKLEEAGLTLDTDDTEEDYVINKGDYELIYFLDTNANSLMFVVTNRTDSAKTVNECTVSGVYVDEYDVEDGSLTVIFPGDVQIGMDISDVEAKWGEPSDTYEGEYSYTYTWYDEDTYNYCSVNVDPGTKKVIAIDLDGQDL